MRFSSATKLAIGTSALLIGIAAPMASAGGAAAAPQHQPAPYVCTGGAVPAGTYASLTVTGVCYTPAGNITVEHSLWVARGAMLDAVTAGDPTTGTPVVPATLDVGGNVFVRAGAALLLGCSPNISCSNPPGITYDHIGGNLTAYGAQGVVVHSASIGGNATVIGGGGGSAGQSCAAQDPSKPTIAALKPWSENAALAFTPVYTDFEDASVGGTLTLMNIKSCWLGSLRNIVGGSAIFTGNRMGDPDAMELANNLVARNLSCYGNQPRVQFGDGGAGPNMVGGWASVECGFKVKLPNPAPEAQEGKGIYEHISVSTRQMRTHYGTYTSAKQAALPPVTTTAGDTITAALSNVSISGFGLTGTATYDPTQPPGSSGQALLRTTYPGGWSSFTAYITCTCSFRGQHGTVTIRAYGTISPSGHTSGTFLITSGGGPTRGVLGTLAGFGTFTSSHQPANTLRLTEHLAIT